MRLQVFENQEDKMYYLKQFFWFIMKLLFQDVPSKRTGLTLYSLGCTWLIYWPSYGFLLDPRSVSCLRSTIDQPVRSGWTIPNTQGPHFVRKSCKLAPSFEAQRLPKVRTWPFLTFVVIATPTIDVSNWKNKSY